MIEAKAIPESSIDIRLFDDTPEIWDNYVTAHKDSTLYHLFAWGNVMEEAFGHKKLYLGAYLYNKLVGILPLILVKSKLFGSCLTSMPFLNYGGVCTNHKEAVKLLYVKAVELAKANNVDYLEIRNLQKPSTTVYKTKLEKATFILALCDNEKDMLKVFRKQTRNRIRKAEKYGLRVENGACLSDDFYEAFSVAMKEHGTPVLGQKFFRTVLKYFGEMTGFYVAYKDKHIIGSKLTISFKDTVYQIWGGYPQKYRYLQANYLLSWEVVKQAIKKKYRYCDFGRSNISSGPADFKRYFGCEQHQLYWEYPYLPSGKIPGLNPQNKKFRVAISIWKKLPLGVTRLVGPVISKKLP
ncbi:MAG: FemAB family PEP-CTERM system-associated protein [Candidatus Zixiibacteriota bacterium]|nr:MAG: FemAB family PEP-CTERM system-associated protein [candidate division Zixibacteria bacterium]